MRCRVGDLAVIVQSHAGHEGKIVRCIRLLGSIKWIDPKGGERRVPTWEIDKALTDWSGKDLDNVIADDQLRPIRPGDISDEEVRDLYTPNLPVETL